MVLVFEIGQLKELFADLDSVEAPVGFLGNCFKPSFILETRIDAKDFFKEDVFAKCLNLFLKG